MATTINSGYGNSPKLTANIADHADVYGGRALVFDGVVDAVQTPSIDLGTTHSVSCWVKTSTGSKVVIGIDTSNFLIYLNSNLQIQYDATGSPVTSTDALVSGAWNHVVVTRSGTTVNYYINGQVDSGGADTINANDPLNGVFALGGISNFYFNGSMADVKFFDAQLTEAQVQELYRKPENTPSAVQDNLVAWYPMIEGNPESPQSIVYDHSKKKLGSELVTSNTIDNWTVLGSGTSKANITNGVTLTAGTDVRNHFYEVSGTSSGKLYKFNVDAFIDDVSDTNAKINVYDGSASNLLDALTTTSQNFTFYFIHNGTPYIQFDGFDNGTTVNIQNMSIKEVLMGNHATTNFFGDMSDLLSSAQKTALGTMLDSDDNSFIFTNGNTPTGTNKFSAIDGTIEITSNTL